MLRIIFLVMAFLSITACANNEIKKEYKPIIPVRGSIQWFNWVDHKVVTGDQAGHGPDIGSSEWCSVIDFKLFNKASGVEPCSAAWNLKVTETLQKR